MLQLEHVGLLANTGRLFGTPPQFRMNLQHHDEIERAEAALGGGADAIVPLKRVESDLSTPA